MKNEHCDFPWPKIPGESTSPLWAGDGFQVGHGKCPVLSYHPESSNWSEELTELHESDAGADHPIDKASRHLAMDSIMRFGAQKHPIILDVGCSSGLLLEDMRARFSGALVIGSDFIAAPLRKLADRIPDMPLLQFDLRKCPLPDKCVDVITALNVLEHIDDDALATREVARVLKPGGIAHFEVPCGPDLYDIYDEMLMHHRRYSLDGAKRLMKQAGLEVIRTSHLGFLLYPVFCLVKRRNKRFLSLSRDEKMQIVRRKILESRKSTLLSLVTKVELWLGQYISYPIGIRCVISCRKS